MGKKIHNPFQFPLSLPYYIDSELLQTKNILHFISYSILGETIQSIWKAKCYSVFFEENNNDNKIFIGILHENHFQIW